MLLVEELAARGWPAAETLRRDGWLLRHTPSLTRRRSNSALPLAGDHGDPRSSRTSTRAAGLARSCRSLPPRSAPASTPSSRAGAGRATGPPTSSSPMPARSWRRTAPGEVALADRPDAGWVAAWAACEERPDADEHARVVLARIEPATAYARAADDLGVGLAVCERGWAGLFCVATAAERAPARHRGPRGPRADDVGRRARRAAPLPPGRERQRASPRPLRARRLRALTRLSLPGGPGRGAAV